MEKVLQTDKQCGQEKKEVYTKDIYIVILALKADTSPYYDAHKNILLFGTLQVSKSPQYS